MLDKFTKFLDEKLSGPMMKLGQQRHLQSIRDGIIATLPLIIVGSFFIILAAPPLPQNWGIYKFLTSNAATIMLPYRMTMYIMTLYATFGIGYSLAKSYKLDGISGGVLAEIAFLCTITPVNVSADFGAGVSGWALPMGNLGGGGLFVSIVVSIIAVEIYRLTDKSKFKISMPKEVPPSVARSFEALVPTALVIIIIGGLSFFAGFNWHTIIATVMAPFVSAADSLPSVLILIFLITAFWSFGIHGVSIIGSLARPIWLQLLETNTTAVAAGTAPTTIASEPFFQWFVWIGGSGCTIGLAILLAFASKAKFSRALGKTAILPCCFNINEPIIFGTPIVLNPTLIIPFILTPMICATIAWMATAAGMVDKVIFTAPWTLPAPIGAYLATGGDWRAAVLAVILIILSVVIYYPFFKMYDKQQLVQEKAK